MESWLKESLIQYVWKTKLYNLSNLTTTEGQKIQIQDGGQYNPNAGPDFLNANLTIENTRWVGSVEVHTFSSQWLAHGHQNNEAYNSVILHLVYEEDKVIMQGDRRLPCLELKGRIPHDLLKRYLKLAHTKKPIPCGFIFHKIETLEKEWWIERMIIERLQQKTELIWPKLKASKYDWETILYRLLARSLGGPVNAWPMEQLMELLPLNLIQKHRTNRLQVEALLFGQAGLLQKEFKNLYPKKLQLEYQFLRNKYSLQPMDGTIWKFHRMRPAGFPTIRIAQLAALIIQISHLFSKMLAAKELVEIENLFQLRLSHFWQKHFRFEDNEKMKRKSLGKSGIHKLVINAWVPLLFCYGEWNQEPSLKDRALGFLKELPAEKNKIVRDWEKFGWPPNNAGQSQGLLHLRTKYCDKFQCLRCGIGHAFLRSDYISTG